MRFSASRNLSYSSATHKRRVFRVSEILTVVSLSKMVSRWSLLSSTQFTYTNNSSWKKFRVTHNYQALKLLCCLDCYHHNSLSLAVFIGQSYEWISCIRYFLKLRSVRNLSRLLFVLESKPNRPRSRLECIAQARLVYLSFPLRFRALKVSALWLHIDVITRGSS